MTELTSGFHFLRQLTTIDKNDIGLFAGVCVLIYIYRYIVTYHIFQKLSKSKLLHVKNQYKFIHRGYDLLHYTMSTLLGIFALYNRPYGYCFYGAYTSECGEDFKQAAVCDMTVAEKIYYMLFTAYYVVDLFYTKTQSDPKMHVFHHFITLSLIFISIYIRTQVIGIVVMLSHDIVDCFLYLGKILIYTGHDVGKDVSLVLFALSCTWFRMINYPWIVFYGWRNGFQELPDHHYAYFTEGFILFALLGCHIFWFIEILQAVFRIFKEGTKAISDTRSDSGE